MRSIYHNTKVVQAIPPQAVGTTGAGNGSLSKILDVQGFGSKMFTYHYGTAGATGDTITPVVLESDTNVSGDFTSVADGDLIGTEADAALPAQASARTSGVGKNVSKKLGYKGHKRYLRTRLYGLGTATGLVAADLEMGDPQQAPVVQ